MNPNCLHTIFVVCAVMDFPSRIGNLFFALGIFTFESCEKLHNFASSKEKRGKLRYETADAYETANAYEILRYETAAPTKRYGSPLDKVNENKH